MNATIQQLIDIVSIRICLNILGGITNGKILVDDNDDLWHEVAIICVTTPELKQTWSDTYSPHNETQRSAIVSVIRKRTIKRILLSFEVTVS